MYVDNQGLLSDAQALTATAFSTNTYDSGANTPSNDVGDGEPMCVAIGVDVAADFTSANETYQFDIVQSANANLSSPDVLASRIITAANLTLGSLRYIDVPAGAQTKRFIGIQYTLGGTTPTITVTAAYAPKSMIQRNKIYAKGYTIS